ncbi:hypothetical protein C8Q79DRAFT_1000850 [Trametes meyenii]|nr:hypothetical protein C8Q79DRAFT_1000850 [Trametes meyenii]
MCAGTRRLFAEEGIARSIGKYTRMRNLCALLLTDKMCNTTLTPTLYHSVLLDQPIPFLRCLSTLAASPGKHAFRRDLSALVHRFTIRNPETLELAYPLNARAVGPMLFACLVRMDNLRHFSCSFPLPFSLGVFGALINGSHPKLQSIDLIPDVWEPLEILLAQSIKTFLRNHADSIRSLRLTSSLSRGAELNVLGPLLPSDVVFPSLAELEIGMTIFSHPSLQNTATIKSLYIHEAATEDDLDTQFSLPPDAFPSLQTLICPNATMLAFLPENTTRRRPIRAVRLNEASYGMESLDYNGDQSDWDELLELLPHLPFSAVPVTELSLAVWDLSIEELRKVVPYVRDLEKFVIVVDEGIENSEELLIQLGPVLIAQLPRLHTLLLSDMPLRVRSEDGEFQHARDIALQQRALAEYERHSSTLRRVAFAAEVGGWEKCGGRWCPVSSGYLIEVS